MSSNRIPLDEAKLSDASRAFVGRLFAWRPELKPVALMERDPSSDRYSLVIEPQSPTGDPDRRLGIWMDQGTEPSVGFGPWHTHASVWCIETHDPDEHGSIVALVEAILNDEFVIIEDVGGKHEDHTSVLDLRQPDALADELTSQYSPGRIRIKSWSGLADRDVGLEDLGFA